MGDAFLNVDRGTLDHLWVVIAKSEGMVTIVNFTTKQAYSPDETCIISKGEHSFVVHDTVINYQRGMIVEDATLERTKGPGLLEMQDRASDALLRRIQHGALASQYTPKKVQDAVRQELGEAD